MKTGIFIDTEYYYLCASHQGMIPSYKNFMDKMNDKYPDNTKIAYFVGYWDARQKIIHYLMKNGMNYANIHYINSCSRPQIVGVNMTIDVVSHHHEYDEFVFVGGEDYLVPIISFLKDRNKKAKVYYFDSMISHALISDKCEKKCMSKSYLMYGRGVSSN